MLFFGSNTQQTILYFLIRVLVLMTALPVHEFAHAWAAKKLGDRTAEYQGRLTLNPLAHLDPIGSLLLVLTGFGWAKPVPVNPVYFKNRRQGLALTSLAGPLSNLLMAFIAALADVIYQLVTTGVFAYGKTTVFEMIVTLNIGLAVFNLLPIPPLDGSKIFLSERFYFKMMEKQQIISVVFLLLLLTGALSYPISYLVFWFNDGIYSVISFLFRLLGL